jgi:hypothetical protein
MVLCDVSALFLTGEGIFFCDWIGYRMFLWFVAGGIGDGKKRTPPLRCGKTGSSNRKSRSSACGEG